jgi:hypothetical protein
MRRPAVVVGIVVTFLVLAVAAPAHSATRLRVYRGETSDGHRIAFRVARTDAGRFIREMQWGVTFTCEDETTQEWVIGWGLSNSLPITDGAFSFDEVDSFMATHLAGHLGPLHGSGTLAMAVPALTADEQAQLCTTGDLTWEVEFVRIIIRT